MKKYIYNLLYLSLFLVLYSCDKFEGEPLDRITDKDVWHSNDPTGGYAQRYLKGVYVQLPTLHNRIDNDYLDCATDDGVSSSDLVVGGYNVNAFRHNQISPSRVVDNAWSRNYTGIRRANVFLKNIDDTYIKPELEKEKKYWKAEARFLRAFYYFELIKRWGGVPLLGDEIYTENDKIVKERSSFEDCVTYIVSEIDEIKGNLLTSVKDAEVGRITLGTALALKSRILLYCASPLNNKDGDVQLWANAAEAAKAVMVLNKYKLSDDFVKLFTSISNPEVIFVSPSSNHQNVERNNSPVGYFHSGTWQAKGFTSPSQNLVDAFLTINGLPISEDKNYDSNRPYLHRDLRLDATVFYNGSTWLNRKVETFEGGLDKPNRGNLRQTKTGYYLRKFMGDFADKSTLSNTQHGFVIIRYAEILLNYAEALNEVDYASNKAEIEKVLKLIRSRAGILSGPGERYGLPNNADQDQMRVIIQNERRIELAFEEHRFWDLRRWKLAELYLNMPVEGVTVNRQGDINFTYTRKVVTTSTFDASRMYLYPIPLSEINTNTELIQNPNWNF